MSRTIVVTGFPTSFLATRLVRALTESPDAEVICVVHSKFEAEAVAKRDALDGSDYCSIHQIA